MLRHVNIRAASFTGSGAYTGGRYDCIALADETGEYIYFGLAIYDHLEDYLVNIALGRDVSVRETFDTNSKMPKRVVMKYDRELDVALIYTLEVVYVLAGASKITGQAKADYDRSVARELEHAEAEHQRFRMVPPASEYGPE